MADIFNLTDTWNDAGTTFQAIKMNVTDTASNAASSFLQFQIGGTTKADIKKDGSIRLTGTSSGAAYIYSDTQFRLAALAVGFDNNGGAGLMIGSIPSAGSTTITAFGGWGPNGLSSTGTRYIGFNSGISVAPDARFHRTAAGIVRYSADGTAGATLEFAEQTAPSAPSANFVRIYAEDNGAGKTRLMALFATGAAQQIAIEP